MTETKMEVLSCSWFALLQLSPIHYVVADICQFILEGYIAEPTI